MKSSISDNFDEICCKTTDIYGKALVLGIKAATVPGGNGKWWYCRRKTIGQVRLVFTVYDQPPALQLELNL